MKILNYIHATVAIIGIAVTLTSCDEHIEFPDTAMKTCDILCTDGEIVRYDDVVSKGKTPIGVVFHVNQDGKTEGTGSVSVSSRTPRPIRRRLTAIPIPMPCSPLAYLRLQIPSLPCGSMVRVPIYLPLPSSSCFMLHGLLSIATLVNAEVT